MIDEIAGYKINDVTSDLNDLYKALINEHEVNEYDVPYVYAMYVRRAIIVINRLCGKEGVENEWQLHKD